MKFYLCETCGNIITHLETSGVNVVCCGKKMTELVNKDEKTEHKNADNDVNGHNVPP